MKPSVTKKSARLIKRLAKPFGRKNALQPEDAIMRLAKQGELAAAGQQALLDSLKKGLSVTILENDHIYRVYPDGSRMLIKKVNVSTHKYSTGKLRIA